MSADPLKQVVSKRIPGQEMRDLVRTGAWGKVRRETDRTRHSGTPHRSFMQRFAASLIAKTT